MGTNSVLRKKNCSFTEVGKEGEWVYVCGHVRNTYGRNGFCLFVYFFLGGWFCLLAFCFLMASFPCEVLV